MPLSRTTIEYLCGESAPGNVLESWNLYAAYVEESEFDLDTAIRLSTEWTSPHGADAVRVVRKYVIGRYENRTMFAVITVPQYKDKDGKLVDGPEYFEQINRK